MDPMQTISTIKILHLDTNHPLLWEQLEKAGFINEADYTSTKEEVESKIENYHGIVIRSRFKIDKTFIDKVEQRIVIPTIQGLKNDGITYKGFLFIGLMNVEGEPKVIEYNCRMGDPETEVVLHRVKTDFLELMLATCNRSLNEVNLEIDEQTAVTVFLVSGGYPEDFIKGYEISGLGQISDSKVYQAGTKNQDGKILTNGGRVLAITSTGTSIQEALTTSMKNAEVIQFTDKYYRKDVGLDLLKL